MKCAHVPANDHLNIENTYFPTGRITFGQTKKNNYCVSSIMPDQIGLSSGWAESSIRNSHHLNELKDKAARRSSQLPSIRTRACFILSSGRICTAYINPVLLMWKRLRVLFFHLVLLPPLRMLLLRLLLEALLFFHFSAHCCNVWF